MGKTRYFTEFFVWNLVFLHISCYSSEIWISFWAVYIPQGLVYTNCPLDSTAWTNIGHDGGQTQHNRTWWNNVLYTTHTHVYLHRYFILVLGTPPPLCIAAKDHLGLAKKLAVNSALINNSMENCSLRNKVYVQQQCAVCI